MLSNEHRVLTECVFTIDTILYTARDKKMAFEFRPTSSKHYAEMAAYGYSVLGSENAAAFMGRNEPNDLVEKFSIGSKLLNGDITLNTHGEHIVEELYRLLIIYFKYCETISSIIMKLIAIALELPVDYFLNFVNKAHDDLRCLAYPAKSTVDTPGVGMARHRDLDILTILSMSSPGLEIMLPNQEWMQLEINCEEQLVVNIGELMMMWTNNAWTSAEHRAVLTETSRHSIAFFKLVNDSAIIETLPNFKNESTETIKPVIYSELLTERMKNLYQL